MIKKRKILSLWTESPCTINFITHNIYLQKIPRFQRGSIYQKDNVNQEKKKFTDFQRPDRLLRQFRKKIIEAQHPKFYKSAQKKRNIRSQTKIKQKIKRTESTYSKKYQTPRKSQQRLDTNHSKSTLVGDQSLKELNTQPHQTNTQLSSSRRVDFKRLNSFYAGQDPYQIFKNNMQKLKKYNIVKNNRPFTSKKNNNSLSEAQLIMNKTTQNLKKCTKKNILNEEECYMNNIKFQQDQ